MNGLSCAFHGLRHTLATMMMAGWRDVRTAASCLGHASASMAPDIHADVDPDAKRAAVDRVAGSFDVGLGSLCDFPSPRCHIERWCRRPHLLDGAAQGHARLRRGEGSFPWASLGSPGATRAGSSAPCLGGCDWMGFSDLQLISYGNSYNLCPFPLYFVCMKFKEYIASHQAFTTGDLYAIAARETARTLLRRALRSGEVERVRRGAYVSKTGKFLGEAPDPFLVAKTVDPEAIVSYHSALVAHGVAHNVGFECSFRSATVRSPFEYGGVRYVPFGAGGDPHVQTMRSRSYSAVRVTTREQTLVDCLMYPKRAGGAEEALRSCSAFPYLDLEALTEILGSAPAAVVARVGWLLEAKRGDWGIADETLSALEGRLQRGPSKLDPKSQENRGWSRRWRLYLPESEEEVLSWTL